MGHKSNRKHRTFEDIRHSALASGSLWRLGAVDYIIYLDTKSRNNEEIDELEMHYFYDAKRTLLEHEKFEFHDYSPERKRAEKKCASAAQQYEETNPSRDLPF